jgi:hypothetical protein
MFCHAEVSVVELPYPNGDHMRTRALRGRANVQADATRPCRRFMAAVGLSVDATVYISTDRRPYAACASVAHRTCALVDTRTALRRLCARPLTSPSPQCSGYAGYTQIILTRCKQKPFVAVIVIASHVSLGTSTRARSTARSYQLTTGFFAAATSVISDRASSTN